MKRFFSEIFFFPNVVEASPATGTAACRQPSLCSKHKSFLVVCCAWRPLVSKCITGKVATRRQCLAGDKCHKWDNRVYPGRGLWRSPNFPVTWYLTETSRKNNALELIGKWLQRFPFIQKTSTTIFNKYQWDQVSGPGTFCDMHQQDR